MRKFFFKANEDGWLKPVINILGTTIIAICAWLLGSSDFMKSVAILLLVLFLIIMITNEVLFSKSYNQIRQEARTDALRGIEALKLSQENIIINTRFDLELASETIGFLTTRNKKISDAISSLPTDKIQVRDFLSSCNFDRVEMINKTLEGLCHSLVDAATIKGHGTRASIMFRATYMAVTNETNGQILRYLSFFTPDNHVPRSMQLGKFFIKNQGCAGISWYRCRPVIEDTFDDTKEWENNYPGQGKLYKSMICIPVTLLSSSDCSDVAGVITVDTNIEVFFGEKDNRSDEERGSRWIRPYSNFVAVIESFSNLNSKVT